MSILPQPLMHSLRRALRHCCDALLPGSCLLCGNDSGAALLCTPCYGDLPGLADVHCPQCAERSATGERCGACLKAPPHFTSTTALFRYEFPVDRLVHALKYDHQLAVASWFGHHLAERLTFGAHDRIIPLPLHPGRMRERGFNQSVEIARVLGNRLGLPVDRSSLQRTRATLPQADLPFKARHANVRGAFECSVDLSGQRILLVDDVLTTGNTANECARILKLHGASDVSLAIVARALKHGSVV